MMLPHGYAWAAGRATPDVEWASRGFRWRDGERLISFGRGAVGATLELLESEELRPFVLLTTRRAAAAQPALAAAALAVVDVPPGPVPDAAAAIEEQTRAQRAATLVALGGGRVIDAAKVLAAAHGQRAAAVPTTLSGAELTSFHRPLPDGRGGAPLRPRLVVSDPSLVTSQPEPALTASAMNAFAHAMEALYVAGANPVPSLAAVRSVALIVGSLERMFGGAAGEATGSGRAEAGTGEAGPTAVEPGGARSAETRPEAAEGERDALALGGLLAGYAFGATGPGLHHVICQTIVRLTGAPHAQVNAVMLPHTLRYALPRAREALLPLVRALTGADDGPGAARLVERLAARSLVVRLGQLGVVGADLPKIAAAALARPDLQSGAPVDERAVLSLLKAAL
jgi:alcohol dehydrogenase class IV